MQRFRMCSVGVQGKKIMSKYTGDQEQETEEGVLFFVGLMNAAERLAVIRLGW